LALGLAAASQPLHWPFWPLWLLAGLGQAREVLLLHRSERGPAPGSSTGSFYGRQFVHQVQLGALLLLALIVGRS
jgi:4-hydroxybenzoate polyprenyltransferase